MQNKNKNIIMGANLRLSCLETRTSDRCLICIFQFQLLGFSGFSLYPLSFILYSPFKRDYNVSLMIGNNSSILN